ncbi:MAG: hypothetical protein V5A24_08475 [Haloarculaceae archaeon]
MIAVDPSFDTATDQPKESSSSPSSGTSLVAWSVGVADGVDEDSDVGVEVWVDVTVDVAAGVLEAGSGLVAVLSVLVQPAMAAMLADPIPARTLRRCSSIALPRKRVTKKQSIIS